MKVLFLSNWYPIPADNGSKIRIYYLLKALAERHEVTLISFAHGTAQPGTSTALATICKKVIVVDRNPILENRASTIRRFTSNKPVATRPIGEMSTIVSAELKTEKYDVVIASSDVMAIYAQSAGSNIAKVLELHTSLSRWMRERYEAQLGLGNKIRCWFSWKKAQVYEAQLFTMFDLVTMVSDQDRDESLYRKGKFYERIKIIPNGVNCHELQPFSGAVDVNRLVYSGSVTYSANLDAVSFFVTEIMPLITQSIPGTFLTVTGATEGVDLSRLNMKQDVRFTGYLEDVHDIVGRASVSIAPIRDGGGTRIKILEAMALGTPVVATRKAAEGLSVNHGEHILLADTPKDFAEATIRLMQDDSLRTTLSINGRQFVEAQHDWTGIGQKFVQEIKGSVRMKRGTLSR